MKYAFSLKAVCIKPITIDGKEYRVGSRAKMLLGNTGISFYNADDKAYGYTYNVSDVSEYFRITGTCNK